MLTEEDGRTPSVRAMTTPHIRTNARGGAMDQVIRDVSTISRIGHGEAMQITSVENRKFAEQLRSLDPQGWTTPTDCTLWDVRRHRAHVPERAISRSGPALRIEAAQLLGELSVLDRRDLHRLAVADARDGAHVPDDLVHGAASRVRPDMGSGHCSDARCAAIFFGEHLGGISLTLWLLATPVKTNIC